MKRGECKDCSFYSADHSTAYGTCRKRPPVLIVKSNHRGTVTRFPKVHEDIWCGEFHALATLDESFERL